MKTLFSTFTRGACVGLILATPTSTAAWGWRGHEYVGSVAWALLNPVAQRHVLALLGSDIGLALATVWPDCAKTILGPPEYKFRHSFTPAVCVSFSPEDRHRMWDYVHRNFSNCTYSHRLADCHKAFHFADINVRDHSDYDAADFGAQPFDVVHAIEAAMIVLKCKSGHICTTPLPFDIADKKEALLLLSHLVGDLHQPLHVGAVYLDASNAEATGNDAAETSGGNSLMKNSSQNLHSFWDDVTSENPSQAAIRQACLISPLPNPTPEPIEKWASESVSAASSAYGRMSFQPLPPDTDHPSSPRWQITFVDLPSYEETASRVQTTQLIRAGARLAALLNSVWPSKKVAVACR